jgi:putative hydrolase of the HAD superfamily
MIKAVLFDYGGVIKVGHPLKMDLARICNISEEEAKQTEEKRKVFGDHASKGLITDEQFWAGFQKIINKSIPNNCVELAKESYRNNFKFIPEVIKLVEDLKKQEIKVAILSNIFKFEAEVIREKNGYDGFDPVILSYEVGMRKPELDIYKFAIKKLQLKPEECIFIDDKEENLVPAKSLGIRVVLAKNPEQIVKDVLALIKVDDFMAGKIK